MRPIFNQRLWSLGLLIFTTLIWGTTFPLLKDLVGSLSPAVLIGSRFLIAAIVFLPFCRPLNWLLIRDSSLVGAVAFISYLTQVIGLETISANRAAFITSLNVVLVPLLGWQLGRSITLKILVAAGLAFLGIAIMSWEAGGIGWGEVWTFGCALSYAVYILLMEVFSRRHPPRAFTAVQLLAISILGILWAAPNWLSQIEPLQTHWIAIIYLGVVATAFSTLTQVLGQRHLSASETAIIYTLEPVFAAIFAFWWLGERLNQREAIGSGLILVAMLLSQLPLHFLKRTPKP